MGKGGGWGGDTPMHVVKPYVVTYAFFGFTTHHQGPKMTVARPCVVLLLHKVSYEASDRAHWSETSDCHTESITCVPIGSWTACLQANLRVLPYKVVWVGGGGGLAAFHNQLLQSPLIHCICVDVAAA